MKPQPAFTPRCALVTGGAGFIGSGFVHHMLASHPDLQLVVLDRLTYSGSLERLEGLPDAGRCRVVIGDIGDRPLVDRLLSGHDVDTVVHFAAEVHVDRSIADPEPFLRTNVGGTFTLLESARREWLERRGWSAERCRFHHISTDEVFGELARDDPPFTETSPHRPNSPYAASKAAADHLVRAYHQSYGLPVTTTHCSNNYGPRQQREAFIPTVIRACLEEHPIPVYGDGGNIRDWLFVDDHCRGIDLVIRRGRTGEIYTLGGDNERVNLEVVRAICALIDELRPGDRPHQELIRFVPDRPGHDRRYAVNFGKIRTRLGWHPRTAFAAGLRQTVVWHLDQWRRGAQP